jgi:hypothetical protein
MLSRDVSLVIPRPDGLELIHEMKTLRENGHKRTCDLIEHRLSLR